MQAYHFIVMIIQNTQSIVCYNIKWRFWHSYLSGDLRIFYYYFPAFTGCPHFFALSPGQFPLLLSIARLLSLFFFTPFKHLWLLWAHWNNLRQHIIIIWIWNNSSKLICWRLGPQLVVETGSCRRSRTWELMEIGRWGMLYGFIFRPDTSTLFSSISVSLQGELLCSASLALTWCVISRLAEKQ